MDHWCPKNIFINERGVTLNGWALCYYFKEGTREKNVLSSEIVHIKEKGYQYSKSYILTGYLRKFVRENLELFTDIDIIVPIPGNIHSNKRMENLADYLGVILERPVLNILKNKLESSSYGNKKTFEIEYENKCTQFDLQGNISEISNKKVLLFDDIATTGATLVICANELKKAGSKEIIPFVLCTSRILIT